MRARCRPLPLPLTPPPLYARELARRRRHARLQAPLPWLWQPAQQRRPPPLLAREHLSQPQLRWMTSVLRTALTRMPARAPKATSRAATLIRCERLLVCALPPAAQQLPAAAVAEAEILHDFLDCHAHR